MEQKIISAQEQRNQELLEAGLATADCYITRSYLIDLAERAVLEPDPTACQDVFLRLYHVDRFVYDKKENVKSLTVNVGRMTPISVKVVPGDAYAVEYSWTSSDPSVAIVMEADGKAFIKAVGIGSCKLTCSSTDGQIKDECDIVVESIMYKQTKKKGVSRFVPIIAAAVVVAIIALFFIPSGASDPEDPAFQGGNQETQDPVYLSIDKAVGDTDISLLLEDALTATRRTELDVLSDTSRKSTVPSYIYKVYFLKALDPAYLYDKAFPQPEPVENGFLMLTNFAFELVDYGSGERYDRWCSYLYPNFTVAADGTVSYSEDAVIGYRDLMVGPAEMEAWVKAEFNCMSITEIETSG